MYAITGITGQVGGAVAQRLRSSDQPVRAVLRDVRKSGPWAKLGCDTVVADLLDTPALSTAFEGAAGVFVLLPPMFDPTPGFPEAAACIESLRTALMRAGCRKVVALSTIGARASKPNLLEALGRMEAAFESLPMPVTFLRAAWFMENAAWDISAAQTGAIQSYLHPLDRPIPMVSVDDVGRVAADLLQEEWEGQRMVELEGPHRVSPSDVAAAFAKALGHPVDVEPVPRVEWESKFRAQGMKNPLPRMQMLDGFNEGWIDFADRGAGTYRGLIGIDAAIAAAIRSR